MKETVEAAKKTNSLSDEYCPNLSTTKSNSSGDAVPCGHIYFTETKYVANISAFRVDLIAHSGQPGMRPASPLPACNPFPSDSLVAGQLRPPKKSLDPLCGINNRILATCRLGSGDLPEPLEMTLAECVEFRNRAEAGRHLVAADARCEILGCA